MKYKAGELSLQEEGDYIKIWANRALCADLVESELTEPESVSVALGQFQDKCK